MLFAMTSTLCAGRALPLPVYLKIHLVAGHVCDGAGRDLRPKCEMARVCVCVFLCVFADSIKALYMGHRVTGRAAVLVTTMCVSVCVCVWGKDSDPQLHDCIYNVELQFTITPPCNHLWDGGKEIAQYRFSTPVCYATLSTLRGRDADLLHFLTVPIVCWNAAECPWNGCSTFFSWRSCSQKQFSESCLVILNKCCFWLEGGQDTYTWLFFKLSPISDSICADSPCYCLLSLLPCQFINFFPDSLLSLLH